MPYTEMENITLAKLPSYLNGLEKNPSFSFEFSSLTK
jgi:hypothetical protein